jgi:hypothetical protein
LKVNGAAECPAIGPGALALPLFLLQFQSPRAQVRPALIWMLQFHAALRLLKIFLSRSALVTK